MSQQKPVATTGKIHVNGLDSHSIMTLGCAGQTFTPTIHHDTYPTIDPERCSFEGQHVFITGASKGIGRATAIAYARAGAAAISLGARSDLADVEQEVLRAAAAAGKPPPKILKLHLDVQNRLSVEAAAQKVDECCGSVDVLMNNAGCLENWVPIGDSDPDEWWNTWEIVSLLKLLSAPVSRYGNRESSPLTQSAGSLPQNMRGPYLMTRSFLPLLLKGSGKTILNISSIGAHVTYPGASGYQTAKFALLRFSEFTNAEYGEQGIVAFSLHPGGVKTETALNMPQEVKDMLLIDTPELAANTIVYLTQQRQEWLRGRYVDVTWDMDELFAKKDEIVEKDLLMVRMAVE
ncbi:MAG: hypothetical protein LQ341_001758 [Variospora aurantia]|nr:MAG: hypothetical protein LQ341_001758 [Variospora aurantia]